jgi:NifU-like protein
MAADQHVGWFVKAFGSVAKFPVAFYPKAVAERLLEAASCGRLENCDAAGTGVSMVCGAIVRFEIVVENAKGRQTLSATFTSDGCGFAIAAADVLAAWVAGRELRDLGGSKEGELQSVISASIGAFQPDRAHCGRIAIDAFRSALSRYRETLLAESPGGQALICTCFGVTEDTIEHAIKTADLKSVDEVGAACNAGTGCGSCRMLIEEILASTHAETA